MCQWGANRNPLMGYRMGPSRPHVPQTEGCKLATTDWIHYVRSSSGLITIACSDDLVSQTAHRVQPQLWQVSNDFHNSCSNALKGCEPIRNDFPCSIYRQSHFRNSFVTARKSSITGTQTFRSNHYVVSLNVKAVARKNVVTATKRLRSS